MTTPILLAGNSNPELAKKIIQHANISLGKIEVSQFSDGETNVEILEDIHEKNIYILQSTNAPSNHHIMELLLIADAAHRAGARSITAVIPYYGYARQDKRILSAQVPISAKVIADMLTTVGIDKVIMVDLHSEQIQGFFSIPVENIYSTSIFLEDVKKQKFKNPIVISPDVGGVVRSRAFAKKINHADLAIIDKRRPKPNESEVMNIIGEVAGKDCIIIDDLIDTAGTVCNAAKALKNKGANKVVAYITHPVLSGNAMDIINDSVLDELVVTDTIYLNKKILQNCPKIRQLSVASLIGENIKNT